MKISARNQLSGTVVDVKTGATTAHVKVEVAPGQVLMASITNEAVEELGLKIDMRATLVIKASDVLVAVEG